jgi:ubiquinone biosynthesis UbiH/UbiF/VisC/COQ6 family hydroxylase
MTASQQVVIAGGGIVGTTLALLLAERAHIPAEQILVLEPRPASMSSGDAPFDLRVSAIAPGNRALLQELGVWERLQLKRVASYERMVVWHEAIPPDSPDVMRFDAAELGEPDMGSIVENRNLQAALLAACAARGILISGTSLTNLRREGDVSQLQCGDRAVSTELLVGADGAASAVRKLLGIADKSQDYGQQGIVANVRSERPHRYTAWQRFLSTGPLALLPLANGECSIVWSAVRERATALLALSAEEFNAELTVASAAVLGQLELTSERAAFPLQRLAASDYIASGAVLVGDAAHVVHPLAGQGVNLGLQDAVCLAECLAARPYKESLGAAAALRRYQRERKLANGLMSATIDGLNTLFTGAGPVRSWLGREGMAIAGRSQLARQLFFKQAATGPASLRR